MSKYIGEVIIVDNRLQGRFGSNKIIPVSPSKFRTIAILKTKQLELELNQVRYY